MIVEPVEVGVGVREGVGVRDGVGVIVTVGVCEGVGVVVGVAVSVTVGSKAAWPAAMGPVTRKQAAAEALNSAPSAAM